MRRIAFLIAAYTIAAAAVRFIRMLQRVGPFGAIAQGADRIERAAFRVKLWAINRDRHPESL